MARTRKGLSGTPIDRSADANRVASGAFTGMSREEIINHFQGTTDRRKARQSADRAVQREAREEKTMPLFQEPKAD